MTNTSVKQSLINSSIATVIAELTTLPICIVKTNYQNSTQDVRGVVSKIYNQGGLRAFYRASVPSVCGQILSSSTKYAIYRKMEDISSNKVVNGITSGILSTLLTHPVDFVKIHYQMNLNVLTLLRENGVRVLYRGYSKSFSKVVIGSAMFYPLHDYLRDLTSSPTLSAFGSAVISTTVMHPIDYLKTRHIYGRQLYQGGLIKYYRGLWLNLARIVPHFTIMMTVIAYLEKKYN